jgi:hypothetical protein
VVDHIRKLGAFVVQDIEFESQEANYVKSWNLHWEVMRMELKEDLEGYLTHLEKTHTHFRGYCQVSRLK